MIVIMLKQVTANTVLFFQENLSCYNKRAGSLVVYSNVLVYINSGHSHSCKPKLTNVEKYYFSSVKAWFGRQFRVVCSYFNQEDKLKTVMNISKTLIDLATMCAF